MALKIEKTSLNQAFESLSIRQNHPDSGSQQNVNDGNQQNPKQNQKQNSPSEQDDQKNEKIYTDKQSVSAAIQRLITNEQFIRTGMSVQLIERKDGIFVQVSLPTGAVAKVMSALDFMQQHKNSTGDKKPRGKFLDQKF